MSVAEVTCAGVNVAATCGASKMLAPGMSTATTTPAPTLEAAAPDAAAKPAPPTGLLAAPPLLECAEKEKMAPASW